MRLPLSWLKEFVSVALSPEKLAEMLTQAGIGVESVVRPNLPDTIVVGWVLDVTQHPNADKLNVAKVDIGKKEPRSIVCGAPNLAAGQRVAVALPGTILPNGQTIKEVAIRGVASSGMICAEDELGIGSDHTGIVVFDAASRVGTVVARVLGTETVLDLDVTPNRADCLSMLGCAREVAALTRKRIRAPRWERRDRARLPASTLRVTVQEPKCCFFYGARVVENVRVGPSPAWMRERLQAAGIRPLSNVIDVTNYVMLETGQPLHAFDARALERRRIIVRRARKGELLPALDQRTYTLDANTLIIAGTRGPLAIAGIIGGDASGVRSDTTTIVLESAVFDPVSVRRTSKRLGIRTESSYRFERCVDPHLTLAALDRAATLLEDLAGGIAKKGRVVVGRLPKAAKVIRLSVARTNEWLSLKLTGRQMATLLKREGCIARLRGGALSVAPPHWRADLAIEEDLIEEVGRLYGYHRLPLTALTAPLIPAFTPPMWLLKERIRDALMGSGYHETLSRPMYARSTAKVLGLAERVHVCLVNPLNSEQELLRSSLLPSLITKAALAERQGTVVEWFEIGRCFRETAEALPEERERLGMISLASDPYRELKGALGQLLDDLGVARKDRQWVGRTTDYGPGQELRLGDRPVGFCAVLQQSFRERLKLREIAAVAEVGLETLVEHVHTPRYRTPSQFPSVRRDLAFWVPSDVRYEDVARCLSGIDPLLVGMELFDVFERNGRRSFALHLLFQARNRTLTSQEVDRLLARMREALSSTCRAEIREA